MGMGGAIQELLTAHFGVVISLLFLGLSTIGGFAG